MMIEPVDSAAARPVAQATAPGKISEQEPSRPVEGTKESLDSGLDVNRDGYGQERRIDERQRDPESEATTYDARGTSRERRPPDSPPPQEGESVDLFV